MNPFKASAHKWLMWIPCIGIVPWCAVNEHHEEYAEKTIWSYALYQFAVFIITLIFAADKQLI